MIQSIADLPPEVLGAICSHLDLIDLFWARRVAKYWAFQLNQFTTSVGGVLSTDIRNVSDACMLTLALRDSPEVVDLQPPRGGAQWAQQRTKGHMPPLVAKPLPLAAGFPSIA